MQKMYDNQVTQYFAIVNWYFESWPWLRKCSDSCLYDFYCISVSFLLTDSVTTFPENWVDKSCLLIADVVVL